MNPIHIMAAEILACCDPDPDKRKAHRLQKLESFPEAYRARVRDEVNRIIKTRNQSRISK